MKSIFVVLAALCGLNSLSQPAVQWITGFSGTYSYLGVRIDRLSDGSMVAATTIWLDSATAPSDYHGLEDFYVTKLDQNGNVLWSKCFGGPGEDYLFDVKATNDGGCIAVGSVTAAGGQVQQAFGEEDIWMVKISAAGQMQWEKTIGNSDIQNATSVVVGTDGYYYIAGASETAWAGLSGFHNYDDAVIIKISSSGYIAWQKAFGGSDSETATDIIALGDGNLMFCGYSNSSDGDLTANSGESDGWLVCLSSNGSKIFSQQYGGSMNDELWSIVDAGSGNIAVAGSTASDDGDLDGLTGLGDVWLLKTNSNGLKLWSKSYGVPGQFAMCYSLSKSTSGEFFIPAYFMDMNIYTISAMLLKTDAAGIQDYLMIYQGEITLALVQSYISPSNQLFLSGYSDDPDAFFSGNIDGAEFVASMGDANAVEELETNSYSVHPSGSLLYLFGFSCESNQVVVSNIVGQKVLTEQVSPTCIRLMTMPEPGLYFLQVTGQDKPASIPFYIH